MSPYPTVAMVVNALHICGFRLSVLCRSRVEPSLARQHCRTKAPPHPATSSNTVPPQQERAAPVDAGEVEVGFGDGGLRHGARQIPGQDAGLLLWHTLFL